MKKNYEVVIIGTGTAGETAAGLLNEAGKHTAMIDNRPYGGTCALRGCQPKKYFVVNTHLAAETAALFGKGFNQPAITNWRDLQTLKRQFTDPVPAETERSFREKGIDTYHGTARFEDAHTISIDNEPVTITAESIVIATGARPKKLPVTGSELASDSDDVLELEELPESLIFIGGGYISLEFAFIAGLSGSKVTILQRGNRVLPQFPASIVGPVIEKAQDYDITVRTGVNITGIESDGNKFRVETEESNTITGDYVIAAIGRVPNIEALQLDKAGVDYSRDGISVDDSMHTSVSHIYAIGDCITTKQLSPLSDMEAKTAAANIIGSGPTEADYSSVPTVVFTYPQMASVGMTIESARNSGRQVNVKQGNGAGWPNYRRINASLVYYETVADSDSGELLGAHLVGPYAGELINLFALAIRHKMTSNDIEELPWAYPTYSSDIKYMVSPT